MVQVQVEPSPQVPGYKEIGSRLLYWLEATVRAKLQSWPTPLLLLLALVILVLLVKCYPGPKPMPRWSSFFSASNRFTRSQKKDT